MVTGCVPLLRLAAASAIEPRSLLTTRNSCISEVGTGSNTGTFNRSELPIGTDVDPVTGPTTGCSEVCVPERKIAETTRLPPAGTVTPCQENANATCVPVNEVSDVCDQ
jgi:hypothetical protein